MKIRLREALVSLLSGAGILAISVLLPAASPAMAETAYSAKTIRIGGTGTALAVMRQLGSQFHEKHPEVVITVFPSLGSTGGIKALAGGDIDIAVSFKVPGDGQYEGLKAVEYGETPFVFITHGTNKISNITLEDVVDIYDGRTTKWPDGSQIRLIIRPASEASTIILRRMSADMDRAVKNALTRRGLAVAITDQENVDLMEKLPGSFGAASLCQLISEKRSVQVLSLDSVKPSVESLAKGIYPYYKDLFIITGPKSSPAAGQFVDYIFSRQGQSFLIQTGHLVPDRKK